MKFILDTADIDINKITIPERNILVTAGFDHTKPLGYAKITRQGNSLIADINMFVTMYVAGRKKEDQFLLMEIGVSPDYKVDAGNEIPAKPLQV